MWGRKVRRIRELEEQLVDARQNMAQVKLDLGALPGRVVHVRRGVWYTFSTQFRVGQDLDNAEWRHVFLGARNEGPFFDGSAAASSSWTGERT